MSTEDDTVQLASAVQMGSDPNQDETLTQIDVDTDPTHNSDDNVQLSSWQQWKLIMTKNGKLMSRDLSTTLCITIAPALIILAISAVVLASGDESYDPSLSVTASMRDGTIQTAMADKGSDQIKIFDEQKHLVGDILFATTTADFSTSMTTYLCDYLMNQKEMYKSATEVMSSLYFTSVMPTTCSNPTSATPCACAVGTQVFDGLDALDTKMLALAAEGTYTPVTTAVVINSYDSSTGQVGWDFYYNRTLVEYSVDQTNSFTFYNSLYWQTFSAQVFYPVQRYVDSYFINVFKSTCSGTSTCTSSDDIIPYFQVFPFQDWKYNAAKFAFLGSLFQQFLGFCLIFTLSQMVQSIVDEKRRRIKEGMMMMGLKNSVFWMTWFAVYFAVFTLVSFLCTCAAYVFVFRKSNFFIVWGFLFTYLMSVLGLGMFISTLFTDPGTASITAIFTYLIGIFCPGALTGLSKGGRIVLSIVLSPFAFYWGFGIFGTYEGSSQGVTAGILSDATEQGFNSPIKLVYFWAICAADAAIYMFLAWYCDQTVPGEFGAKESWYFCLTPSYWCGSESKEPEGSCAEDEEIDPDDFQKVDETKMGEPAIKVRNLRKIFWSNGIEKIAVHNFSIDVYEGQVTALLGHNGAGKSTTFNMLSGLMPPTQGDAAVYGRSIKDDLTNVRKNLGVCPQHDVLWDQLTVMEHLQLFAALKGVPPLKIDQLCFDTIAAVGLTEKTHQYSVTLSGGQKRKLSIGIATIGNSKVVYLDEPTSGMDPFSRRSTWEVIKKHKPGHVIIFTTHFMDEADLLGDRVAIMSEGKLRCCGDSLFLKKRWGLGYHLTVSKHVGLTQQEDQILSEQIKATVTSAVPQLDLEEDLQMAGAEMAFQLPKGETLEEEAMIREAFVLLFSKLDELKTKFSKEFDSWGISMTTLEEVFLKLAADEHAHKPDHRRATGELIHEQHTQRESASAELETQRRQTDAAVGSRVSGGSGIVTHFKAIFMKRLLGALRDKFNLVIQVFVPLIFILLALIAIKYGLDLSANDFTVDASQFPSPLYVPYYCSGSSTATPSQCPGYFSSQDQIPTLTTTMTTTVGLAVTSSSAQTQQFTCSDYIQETKQAYPFGSAGNPSLLLEDAQGVYHNSATGATTVIKLTPDCVKAGSSCTTAGATVSDLYKCTSSTSPIIEMSNYLYENRNKDGPDAKKESKYGAISFDYVSGTTGTLAQYPYVVQTNGSAYNGPITYANFANNLLLRKINSESSLGFSDPQISLRMKAGPWTSAEEGNAKTVTGIVLAFFLIIAFSIVPATYIYTLVTEVHVKAKHQQMISGTIPAAYWFGTFLWDFIFYNVPMWLTIGLIFAFQQDQFYKSEQFVALMMTFFLYGLASIPQTYCLSFFFRDENTALIYTVFLYAFSGFILFLVSFFLGVIESTQDFNDKLRYVLYFVPQFAFAQSIYNLQQYFYNPAFNAAVCECSYSSPWDLGVCGTPMIYMGVLSFVFTVMTLVLQSATTSMDGCLSALFHKSPKVPPDPPYDIDDDVIAEAARVDELGEGDLDNLDQQYLDDHPIVVKHLRKVFYGRGNISAKVAVRDVSFQVPVGEVFAYLGINGAGKTTSISMMAGEFPPTSGQGKLAGLDMCSDREEINKYMGYCPQFDALFPKLTAREHLHMYARIKGIAPETETEVVDKLIEMMNLSSHCDREAGGYSGGNKRKLSVAIALLGGPKIVFLDEPSTGMDPEARRFMWKVIASTMAGRSVILTTHSMEEAEALSNKIAIMVGGRLRCIGTNQHLKTKFGRGYSLEIRAPDSQNADIRTWVSELFPASVLIENLGNQLRYQIPMEGLQLSAAWNSVEDGKHKHGVTEYAISQTTLEQVFVRFAAEQEEETGMDGAALAASIRQTIPNCMDMLCCKPSQNHEWSVPLDAEGRNRIEVKVQFAYGACLCCKANPGVVTVDGLPVKAVDDQGQQTEEDLLLTGRTNPGCIDSSCCGCTSCCGFSSCFCCRRTNQMFYHSGKVFEVIDYNEIPGTSRARPVFLMVNGKEASSGIERGRYLATVFQEGGKKYCCMIGCPLGILFFLGLVLLANKAYGAGLFLIVVTLVFMVWFCIWCICGNWCGRAGHYRNTPELMVAHESVPVTYDQHVTQAAQPSDVADKSPVHVHQPEDSSLSV